MPSKSQATGTPSTQLARRGHERQTESCSCARSIALSEAQCTTAIDDGGEKGHARARKKKQKQKVFLGFWSPTRHLAVRDDAYEPPNFSAFPMKTPGAYQRGHASERGRPDFSLCRVRPQIGTHRLEDVDNSLLERADEQTLDGLVFLVPP